MCYDSNLHLRLNFTFTVSQVIDISTRRSRCDMYCDMTVLTFDTSVQDSLHDG